MKKQPLSYYENSHYSRRLTVHIWLIGLVLIITILAYSCSPRNGCRATRGMGGYGYCPTLQELRKNKKTAYLYCPNTGIIGVWDANSKLSCVYYISK